MESPSCSSRRLSTICRHFDFSRTPDERLPLVHHIVSSSNKGMPVVIGAMVTDIQSFPTSQLRRGTTIMGQVKYNFGGVARNVAECMMKLGVPSFLISVVGDDMPGHALLNHWRSLGLPSNGIKRCSGSATPVISIIFDDTGEVAAGVANTDAVEKYLTPDWILQFANIIQSASILLLDANLLPSSLEAACKLAREANVPVWYEPVSVPKSVRAINLLKYITYVSPNQEELLAMGEALSSNVKQTTTDKNIDPAVVKNCVVLLLEAGVQHVVLTLGSQGLALCTAELTSKLARETGVTCLHIPALPARVASLCGAGDCLVAGSLVALSTGSDLPRIMAYGVATAKQAVESQTNVPERLLRSAIADDAEVALSSATEVDFYTLEDSSGHSRSRMLFSK